MLSNVISNFSLSFLHRLQMRTTKTRIYNSITYSLVWLWQWQLWNICWQQCVSEQVQLGKREEGGGLGDSA